MRVESNWRTGCGRIVVVIPDESLTTRATWCGPTLLALHDKYAIVVVNALTGRKERVFTPGGVMNRVTCAAFDAGRLATAHDNGSIVLTDINTGKRIRELPGHPERVYDVWLRGTTLVSAGGDETVRVWDLDSAASRVFRVGQSRCAIHWSDGVLLACANGGQLTVHNLQSGFSAPLHTSALQPDCDDGYRRIDSVVSDDSGNAVVATESPDTDELWTVSLRQGAPCAVVSKAVVRPVCPRQHLALRRDVLLIGDSSGVTAYNTDTWRPCPFVGLGLEGQHLLLHGNDLATPCRHHSSRGGRG
jgi:hypothetical protein